ncbi:MAG: HAMP domain-containing histidine kinase [Lachnospira sp.]|nr:HAMP domain-containing histidine kinase [Lachnospira sp.]
MKLRSKLFISSCIMFIAPIVLSFLAFSFIMDIQIASMAKVYDVDEKMVIKYINAPNVLMGMMTDKVHAELKLVSEDTPEMFNFDEYLDKKAEELREKMSTLTVYKNGYITYTSSGLTQDELVQFVNAMDFSQDVSDVGLYKGGDYQSLVRKITFHDDAGNHYTVLIITSLSQGIPELKEAFIQAVIAVVCVLILTGLFLYMWIYGSVVKPVNRLKLATNNIKHGNFDFQMPKPGNDEIGDVCKDFEEMRIILKQTAQDKIKSDMEEKELIRNISHDLKTPLTSIKGYLEGIMDGVANTPEKQEKYLRTIANKVNDMDRLIDELTLFSKLDTNRVPYAFDNINLKWYFDDLCDEISVDLDAAEVGLNYNCHTGDSVYVPIDVEQMKRVINNIISNSIKYKEPSRKCVISIDVYDEGEYAHIVMRDNGKGIGNEELPHIFERFYRTDSSRNSSMGGSGIGLAIVKRIVEDHKGKIWAESAIGEGTTMHICLKISKDMNNG